MGYRTGVKIPVEVPCARCGEIIKKRTEKYHRSTHRYYHVPCWESTLI